MSEDLFKTLLPIMTLLLGLGLSEGIRRFERRRKLKAHWAAIRAEMKLCKDSAETLIADKVMSPLYRLPVAAVETAFPILLAEGHVTEEEVLAITRYSNWVKELNRGLDNAAQCKATGNYAAMEHEYSRNLLKAEFLIGKYGDEKVMETAKNIVDGKLLRWWELL